jgi:fructosamine-3-kinase
MDIGMSQLFGAFGGNFYGAYNEAWPMEPGWQERIEICNLYPLMVHVNLFGSGYLGSVESILNRF